MSFKYIPFQDSDLDYTATKVIATAYPGHLVGIYGRFQASPNGLSPNLCGLSVSDIGSTKIYLLEKTSSHVFSTGYTGFTLSPFFLPPFFIPLDHEIQYNHRVIFEVSMWGSENIKIYGNFIYWKE